MPTTDLDDLLAKVKNIVEGAGSGAGGANLESLVVKDVRLKGVAEGLQVATQDQKASIISVVVYVVVT